MRITPILIIVLLSAISFSLLLLATTPEVQAREELVTLPDRDRVTLTIYDPVDLTYVEEVRQLTFNKGKNKLQFSWANTLIDPTSVTFAPLNASADIEILDTSYPRESNEMLIWNVEAAEAGTQAVRITYFTSGISWAASYHALLTNNGANTKLTGYVTVNNRSGEEYADASVRLIIGNINLVETVRDLATRESWGELKDLYEAAKKDDGMPPPEAPGSDAPRSKSKGESLGKLAKRVVKENVGEYFIYTIEGSETISHGWSKRLVGIKPVDLKTRQVYYYKPAEFNIDALVRTLSFYNTEEDGLGNEPLPGGPVQCFSDEGDGRLSYVGLTQAEYLPIGDEAKWNLGQDPLVTMESARMKERRNNLVFTNNGRNRWLSGYDIEHDVRLRFKNMRSNDVEIEVHSSPQHPDVEFLNQSEGAEIEDAKTWKWRFPLAAGESNDVTYTLRYREGSNRR